MQHLASTLVGTLHSAFLLVMFIGLLNIVSWFSLPNRAALAASSPDEYLQEIRKDQAAKDRQQAYQDAVEVTEDPKMGVEKEYEEKVEEYFEAHPEEGGVLQGAKDLVNQATGN
jgi:flagellar biosynthesis/type III secretory pathway M-ring protein FliF/YscJ